MVIKYPSGYVKYTSGYMSLIFKGETRAGCIFWGVSTMKFWKKMRYQVREREKMRFSTVPQGTPIQTLSRGEDSSGD